MIEATRVAAVSRPPRSMAWILLLASAGAVLATGVVATALVLASFPSDVALVGPPFWVALAAASALTAFGLNLRALRFVFLLRRADTRIPIRDAYIGYLAGFGLLLAPLFLGEMAVRAWIFRRRSGMLAGIPVVLTMWERTLDLLALLTIAGLLALLSGQVAVAAACLVPTTLFLAAPICASSWLRLLTAGANRLGGARREQTVPPLPRLARPRATLPAYVASVVAWLAPFSGLWFLATSWGTGVPFWSAVHTAAAATLTAGLRLAPGGVVVAGGRLLDGLAAMGLSAAAAATAVLGYRLATAGVSTALGLLFVLTHVRTQAAASGHFDAIADAYDAQIPEARRRALVSRKSLLMDTWLRTHQGGRRGLDVGCGQGWYVARMRELGYDVTGLDASAGQVARASRVIDRPALVRLGSVLAIPDADDSFDFVYTVNVLHHLPSVADQQRAFAEMVRVLRPGGVVFLHEINTSNLLFRFYMSYVFPSLNCIDEGVERWILPDDVARYTTASVVETAYFTFFPDFLPERVVEWLASIERWLERSAVQRYSAHYMAVLRKPA